MSMPFLSTAALVFQWHQCVYKELPSTVLPVLQQQALAPLLDALIAALHVARLIMLQSACTSMLQLCKPRSHPMLIQVFHAAAIQAVLSPALLPHCALDVFYAGEGDSSSLAEGARPLSRHGGQQNAPGCLQP